jgi:hypothetical protein
MLPEAVVAAAVGAVVGMEVAIGAEVAGATVGVAAGAHAENNIASATIKPNNKVKRFIFLSYI